MNEHLENLRNRINEIESQRRNNLVFHGVMAEPGENKVRLLTKIQNIISGKLNIGRVVAVQNVVRVSSGPDIVGCRPVLVTFASNRDRDAVLLKAKPPPSSD